MITGEEAIARAIAYMGVVPLDGNGQLATRLHAHGESALPMVAEELYLLENGVPYNGTITLAAALPLSETAAEAVLPFGVAMMLAANIGDTALEASMRGLYRQKRGLLSHFIPKPDVLPVSEGC